MTDLLTVDEAQRRVLASAATVGSRDIPLLDASGGWLAAPLIARRDQPDCDLSAMDGYAVAGPGPWQIVGESAAGHPFDGALAPGRAACISTGAMIPAGTDAILILEDAQRDRARLTTRSGATPGDHRRQRGGDFTAGATLLPAGTRVTPGVIALAATAGHACLPICRPRVAIIATGDELTPPGTVHPHATPSSNGVMLHAMLAPIADVVDMGIVPDRIDALADTLVDAARCADLVLTAGGASVGPHDHLGAALAAVTGDVVFWRIAMKPGKPMLFGAIGGARLLGLPGNPASAFVTATLFALPLTRALAGAPDPLPRLSSAPLATPLPAGGPREEYLRAILTEPGMLTPLGDQSSGGVLNLARANILIRRAAGAEPLAAGMNVDYLSLA